MANASVDMKAYLEPLILITAIIIGAFSGIVYSIKGNLVDYSIIAMLFFLFFNVPIGHLLRGVKKQKYLLLLGYQILYYFPQSHL